MNKLFKKILKEELKKALSEQENIEQEGFVELSAEQITPIIKANIVRLYKKNEAELENNTYDDGQPLKYLINTIHKGRPSEYAVNTAIKCLINAGIISNFEDPELTRKPKEDNFKSSGNYIPRTDWKMSDWRGKSSEWD